MKDAGLYFVGFFILQRTGITVSCMVLIENTHTISNIHGEVFKEQVEIHYESYLG